MYVYEYMSLTSCYCQVLNLQTSWYSFADMSSWPWRSSNLQKSIDQTIECKFWTHLFLGTEGQLLTLLSSPPLVGVVCQNLVSVATITMRYWKGSVQWLTVPCRPWGESLFGWSVHWDSDPVQPVHYTSRLHEVKQQCIDLYLELLPKWYRKHLQLTTENTTCVADSVCLIITVSWSKRQ